MADLEYALGLVAALLASHRPYLVMAVWERGLVIREGLLTARTDRWGSRSFWVPD